MLGNCIAGIEKATLKGSLIVIDHYTNAVHLLFIDLKSTKTLMCFIVVYTFQKTVPSSKADFNSLL